MEYDRLINSEIHYHIRWSNSSVDWKPFVTKEEATQLAGQIQKPNESYIIVERDGRCERCKAFKLLSTGAYTQTVGEDFELNAVSTSKIASRTAKVWSLPLVNILDQSYTLALRSLTNLHLLGSQIMLISLGSDSADHFAIRLLPKPR